MGKEIDIYLSDYKIGIEYDGIYWHNNQDTNARERRKDSFFKNNGITIIRIKECNNNSKKTNDNNIYCHYDATHKYLKETLMILFEKLNNITKNNFTVEVNIEKDRGEIINFFRILDKENSIFSKYPNIVKEWDYVKNNNLSPKDVTQGSELKVWWICKKGHSYCARISHRINGSNCPICDGKKILKGYNDLETINPILSQEWNYEKNKPLLPTEVAPSSGKKVWWFCNKGHEWYATINSRNGGRNCPYCSGRYAISGINDLKTLFPLIANEWNYEKNDNLIPENFTAGSSKKVWWLCQNMHEYQMIIAKRTKYNRGCPHCRTRIKNT